MLLACADPACANRIRDDLNEETVAAFVTKWLGRLPDCAIISTFLAMPSVIRLCIV